MPMYSDVTMSPDDRHAGTWRGAAGLEGLPMVLATYAHFLPGDETRARDVMGASSGPREHDVPPDVLGGQQPGTVEPGQIAVL